MRDETEHNRRGLVKLMLKMPALRGRLQIVTATNPGVFSLCGAFEDASSTLDRLRKENSPTDQAVVREYEALCMEIEDEIMEICNK